MCTAKLFLISKQYNRIMFACAAPVPGCPGCGEGSVSVCKHRKNLSHSHGGQVISHIISYIRVYEGPFKNLGFILKLKVMTPLSLQYFPETIFPDTISPCSADTESGEHLLHLNDRLSDV